MKPFFLRMQAFCSYAGETGIDFGKLGGRGLYLITGNTGAGKTTLFDAICFALYGVASGDARKNCSLLRNNAAAPGDETYVEFTFEHRGQIYTVRRSPAYQRPKKRGEGLVMEDAKACLTLSGGRAIEKPTAVDEEIVRILGLTREHFSKIAMIAQGDFADLLLASVEERRRILQKIFGTRYYEIVQDILQKRAGDFRQAWWQAGRAIEDGYGRLMFPTSYDRAGFERFGPEGSAALFEMWRPLAEALILADADVYDRAEGERGRIERELKALTTRIAEAKALNAAFDSLDAANSELEKLRQEEPEIAEMRREAERAEAAARADGDYRLHADAQAALSGAEKELEGARVEYDRLRGELPALEAALKVFDEGEAAARDAERKAGGIRELLPRYVDLSSLNGQIGKLTAERDGALDDLKAADGEKARLTEGKKKAEAERAALEGADARLAEKKADLKGAKEALDALTALLKDIRVHENGLKPFLGAQRAALDAADKAARLSDELTRMRHAFRLGQAGLMASELMDGAPCPVCGSTLHPLKAALPAETPSQARVEAAEAKAEDANQKAADAAVAAEGLRAGREAEEKRLLGIWEKYGSGELSSVTADRAAREQGARFQVLEGEKADLERKAARLGELAAAIPTFDSKIERASEAADKAKESASDKNNQLTEAAAGRDALLKQLPCPAEADARALADGLQRQFDGWEAGRRKADGELRDCQAGMNTKAGERASLEQRQGDLKRQLGEKRGALDAALLREQFASEPEYLDARRGPGAVEGLKQAIGAHEDAVKGQERDRERLERELEHSQRTDLEALERGEEALSRQRGDLEAARQDLNARIQSNRNLIDYLAKKAEDCARLNRDYAMIKNLSDTAGGKNVRDDGGKQSFELFVQSELFDEVIRFANQRFTEMTGGQYELVREEETRDRRSSFGLDLNVLDHFTGIPRPVHTLSGGESFMASLSLALGFADAISARAGGVTLDSMFVDEGFGTLDETALDQVMRSLSKLAQGDKLIGLISHVPEMKRRIDRQIVVKKDRLGGSRAEVIA